MALSECTTITDENGQELLEHGTVFFPVASYCDYLHRIPVPWHWHEELEAAVVVEGSAVLAVGTEKYVLNEGSGFFINTGILHGAWSVDTSASVLHSMCFHPKLIGGSNDSIFWAKYLYPLLNNRELGCVCLNPAVEWEQRAIHFMHRAWKNHVEEPRGFEFEVREALSKLLFLLTDNHSLAVSHRTKKAIRDEERLKAMLQYIQKNYGAEIKVNEIADAAAVSASECLRCFRSTIGTTPIQYVKQYRLQRAVELLRMPELNVSEIAEKCGFYDMSYFSKEFRKAYSCTPSGYRRQREKENSKIL